MHDLGSNFANRGVQGLCLKHTAQHCWLLLHIRPFLVNLSLFYHCFENESRAGKGEKGGLSVKNHQFELDMLDAYFLLSKTQTYYKHYVKH